MSDALRQNLRRLLDQQDRSWRDASLEAGLSESGIKHIINGRSKSPRYENVAAIARVLGVTVAELTGAQPLTQSDNVATLASSQIQEARRNKKAIQQQFLTIKTIWPKLSYEDRSTVVALVESLARRETA